METNTILNENQFGVQNTFVFGLTKVKDNLVDEHPLAYKEKNFEALEEKRVLNLTKVAQGQHACFKLQKEFEFASKVGRLPCLRSSNLMKSVLQGTDDTIDVKDIFNNQREFGEVTIDPHAELFK